MGSLISWIWSKSARLQREKEAYDKEIAELKLEDSVLDSRNERDKWARDVTAKRENGHGQGEPVYPRGYPSQGEPSEVRPRTPRDEQGWDHKPSQGRTHSQKRTRARKIASPSPDQPSKDS